MKIERDPTGRTRIAKGDKSGLGGQFAPDVDSFTARRQQQAINDLNETANSDTQETSLWRKHYPSFIMSGAGVAAALPGAYAGVFNGLSLLGIMLVSSSIIVLGIRENR
jgi:hypothetical protein